jgi:hypothetical protein
MSDRRDDEKDENASAKSAFQNYGAGRK